MAGQKPSRFQFCNPCDKKFRSKAQLNHHLDQHRTSSGFKCSICSAKFMKKSLFKEHIKNTCEAQRNYSCFECGLSFKSKSTISRHINRSCRNAPYQEEIRLICTTCGISFKHEDSLKRHSLFVCNQERPLYECADCGVSFRKKFSLLRHITCKHLAIRKCPDCDFTYIRLRDFAAHVSSNHSHKKNSNIKCALCEDSFHRTRLALNHLIQHHNIDLKHEHFHFNTMDEFYEWKTEMEKKTVTSFRTRNSKQTKKYFLHLYTCHRSGSYEPRNSLRVRKMKEKGSKKINAFCPAEISVRRSKADGTCKVYHIQNHLGHTINDKTELNHMFISKNERKNLAIKISACIPYGKILMENAETSGDQSKADRLHLLSNKDLHNIAASYNLKRPLAAAAIASIEVDYFAAEHAEWILYHKKTNETNEKYPFLKKEDMIMVLMTPSQIKWLKQFGHKTIVLHSACHLNNTNLILYSILVFDDYHDTYAAAFALCNRKSQMMVDIFLDCMKNKVGEIRTSKLVTEVDENYLSNWEKIMGAPECALFGQFRVREAWRRNLKKISTFSKRTAMLRRLHEISFQVEENEFESKMETLLDDDDFELHDFLSYLKAKYIGNERQWVYCYRKQADVRTDTSIEAFHKHLKYCSGQPNKVKDLVSCLYFLAKYLTQKEIDYENKNMKGSACHKMKELLRSHEIVEDPNAEMTVIESISEEGWYVSVSSTSYIDSNSYFVTLTEGNTCKSCKLYCKKCETCVHKYRCNCVDNSIRFNMCYHIHVLCSSFLTPKADEFVTFETNKSEKKEIENLNEDGEVIVFETIKSEKEEIESLNENGEMVTMPVESLENEKDCLIDRFKEVVNKVSNVNQLEIIKNLLNCTKTTE